MIPGKHKTVAVLLAAVVQLSCSTAQGLSRVEPINFTAGTITGVVTDSATSRPLVGAEVRLLTPAGEPVTGQTPSAFAYAPDGTYRFGNVQPGSYQLRALFEGYDSVTVTVGQINAGERHGIDFRLPPRR